MFPFTKEYSHFRRVQLIKQLSFISQQVEKQFYGFIFVFFVSTFFFPVRCLYGEQGFELIFTTRIMVK